MVKLSVLLMLLVGCAYQKYDMPYYENIEPIYEEGILVYHGENRIEHNDKFGCYYCEIDKEYKDGTYKESR